jgi:uncharacterized delta-60 repeat protein
MAVSLCVGACGDDDRDTGAAETTDASALDATRHDATNIEGPLSEDSGGKGDALLDAGASGSFDPTFGTDGLLVLDMPGRLASIDVRPTGAIVLSGDRDTSDGGSEPVVIQTHQNGALDQAFGDGGVVSFGATLQFAQLAVAARADLGETWVATRPSPQLPIGGGYLIRLLADGLPADGGAGAADLIASSSCAMTSPYALTAVNTRVRLAGTCILDGAGPEHPIAYARDVVHNNGITIFADHLAVFPLGVPKSGAFGSFGDAVGTLSTGAFLVAGATWSDSLPGGNLTVGSLPPPSDAAFGDERIALHDPIRIKVAQTALAVAPDDSIFVAFVRLSLSSDDAATPDAGVVDERVGVLKLTADGHVDPSFGTGGVALGPTASGRIDLGDVKRLANGALVIAGTVEEPNAGGARRVFLYKLGADGALESTFGASGALYSDAAIGTSASGLALAPDGKLLVGGTVDMPTPRFAVWRVNP